MRVSSKVRIINAVSRFLDLRPSREKIGRESNIEGHSGCRTAVGSF